MQPEAAALVCRQLICIAPLLARTRPAGHDAQVFSAMVSMVLSVPFAPVPTDPAPEQWRNNTYFGTRPYADDAGLAAAALRLDFRRDDAGYGAVQETNPSVEGFFATTLFPEGERWCWQARHINVRGDVSSPSVERCFRSDRTAPSGPAWVDAGAITSTGVVMLDLSPATDLPSGVAGYALGLSLVTSPPDFYSDFLPTSATLPLVAWLGAGDWLGWVRVYDLAGNANQEAVTYVVPISVTADALVPVPPAPVFIDGSGNRAVYASAYGNNLQWNHDWFADAGAAHVVSTFCQLDGGLACFPWRPGFHSVETANDFTWLQPGDEGEYVARIAAVFDSSTSKTRVSQWSSPSQSIVIDRTPPAVPTALTVTPAATQNGPLSVKWALPADALSGVASTVVEQTQLDGGPVQLVFVLAPARQAVVTPAAEGGYVYRVAAVDRAGNQSAWSVPVTSVIDRTPPNALAPVAQVVDGGAVLVTWVLPIDPLSGLASQTLTRDSNDGGAVSQAVIGTSLIDTPGPGTYTWRLRGTDQAGNVGVWSPPSNSIVVSSTTTPSIVPPGPQQALCSQVFSVQLQATGTAPITFAVIDGPIDLTVSAEGLVSWPASGSDGTTVTVTISATNAAAETQSSFSILVTCSDAGSSIDAGRSVDAGDERGKQLGVGCGCTAPDGRALLLLLLLWARRHSPSRASE